MSNRLQVGLDICQARNDVCLEAPDGKVLVAHRSFANDGPGYQQLVGFIHSSLETHSFQGVDIAGEATALYWFHTFRLLAQESTLATYDPKLYLFNPKLIHGYRESFSPQDKDDLRDPKLVADYLRSHRTEYSWHSQPKYLALQRLTRHHCHLTHTLGREKSYFLAILYLKASEYQHLKPFSDPFGKTSTTILREYATIGELAAIPLADLTKMLDDIGKRRFPDPENNARKLLQVAQDSYPLSGELVAPVNFTLNQLLDEIALLDKLAKSSQEHLAETLEDFPEAKALLAWSGLGPVCTAGILAEIQDTRRFLEGCKFDKKLHEFRPKVAWDGQAAVAKFAGLWWPRKQAGKFEAEDRHLCKQSNAYLRYYLLEGADSVRRNTAEYGAYYQRKYDESKKHRHWRALVLTARKMIRPIFALLAKYQTASS